MEEKTKKSMNINWGAIIFIAAIAILFYIVVKTGETDNNYFQNETAVLDNVEYSITKVSKDEEYINVTIKIKNNSNEIAKYSNMHFYMLKSNGESIKQKSFIYDDGTVLTSGELNPGEEVEGIISWERDIKNKELRIRYYENIISPKVNEYSFEWSLDK